MVVHTMVAFLFVQVSHIRYIRNNYNMFSVVGALLNSAHVSASRGLELKVSTVS